MNTKKFSEAMNELDNKYVEKAINYQAKKRKPVWMKWGAMAACLCLMFCASFFLINHLINDTTQPGGDIKIKIDYLDIYYVSENGTIESDNVYIHHEPGMIFEEWAKLNNITGVLLVGCTKGENDLKIEVGTELGAVDFAQYVEAENGELLIEALKKTFYGYWSFDTFELEILESPATE